MRVEIEFEIPFEKRGFMASVEIKRKIIENTKILLHQNASITIKDIADASYVNIAAINYHFQSKENLMKIVVKEIIDEVKEYITNQVMQFTSESNYEVRLEEIIHYLYNFAIENLGLLNYLFLTNELQKSSSNLLIEEFFSDNEFTRMVYQSLSRTNVSLSQTEISAKYMFLFSSFCIPLFIQISQSRFNREIQLSMFTNPEFRSCFIKNVLKVL